MSKIKIVIAGGHAGATSFATVEEIKARKLNWEIHFIGGRSSLEGKKIVTLQALSLGELGVKSHFLLSGRIQRSFTFWTIPSLLKIPFGFVQSLYLVSKINPDLVLSFGGYAGFPVVLSSWLLRKPIVIHEQTPVAGRANIYSSFFATKIALARKSSLKYFDKNKCIITGNPISKGVRNIKPKLKKKNPPVVLVHGGASGSRAINRGIDLILVEMLKRFRVVHQTGGLEYEKFIKRKENLPGSLSTNYEVYNVIKSSEWHRILKGADILISRSGANVVSEILSVKIPSILIPLPLAYREEQKKNALFAQKFGIAVVIDQKDLTSERLLSTLSDIDKNWYSITSLVKKKVSPDKKSAQRLVDLLESLV